MSIEEARAKILEFRDFLINIDRLMPWLTHYLI